MTWFGDLRARWRKRKGPPVIKTMIDGTEYEVSEVARRQAATNMALDHAKRNAVERLLQDQLGEERGKSEMRRRYPEAFE